MKSVYNINFKLYILEPAQCVHEVNVTYPKICNRYHISPTLKFRNQWFLLYKEMNIHVIIQVKKIQEFDVIEVLFRPSSIFQRFD